MSERKLCHEAHAACPAVSAVNVFAHAGGELQSGLYTRSKIPEYIGSCILAVFVLSAIGIVTRQISALRESDLSEDIWPEIILNA